jgi:hypothetical protein
VASILAPHLPALCASPWWLETCVVPCFRDMHGSGAAHNPRMVHKVGVWRQAAGGSGRDDLTQLATSSGV